MLSRARARSCPVLLALLLACLPTSPALGQDAPPLEADGVALRPAQKPAPTPALKGGQPPGPARPGTARPAPATPAAPKALAPARPVARGPALKNDGKRYLRSLDGNHDARISREEYLAPAKKRFAKLDANGDGVISAAEARTAKARLAERKARSDARRLAQGKPVRQRPANARPPRPYLANVDANRDGRVTRKEFLARREKAFVELDQNRDGVISKDEAKAAKAKKLARRAERQTEIKERQARKQARAEARVAAPAPEPAPAVQAPEPAAASPSP